MFQYTSLLPVSFKVSLINIIRILYLYADDPNVFRCALEEGHPVCGSNGVTYPSACALYQQTVGTVTLKWPYACDDEVNCPQQQVQLQLSVIIPTYLYIV